MNDRSRQKLFSLRDAVLAFSLANLCLARAWYALLNETSFGYFDRLPVSPRNLLALLANFLVLTLAGWAFGRAVRKSGSRVLRWGAGLLLWVLLLNFGRAFLLHKTWPETLRWLGQPLFLLVLGLAGVAFWRWPRWVLRLAMVIGILVAPAAVVTVARTGYLLAKLTVAGDPPPLSPSPSLSTNRSDAPRVVWIIFDELDQRVAFSERPPQCRLPELDRLLGESLVATNAFPPGHATGTSLPALITGRCVLESVPVTRDDLKLLYLGDQQPVRWRAQNNLFAKARAAGCNTALVGWLHPYDRLFPQSLNYRLCFPYPTVGQERGSSLLDDMLNQAWTLVNDFQIRRRQIEYCQDTVAASRHLVGDSAYQLVFLHLPLPHSPYIYDAAKDRFSLTIFSTADGYLQNLQLADKTFGLLRWEMERTGLWDKTWVIVSSDHWWRDSRALDGKIDHRVPFILKAPGQKTPLPFGDYLNTVQSHELVLAMLRNEVRTPTEAVGWLQTHPSPPIPPYEKMKWK